MQYHGRNSLDGDDVVKWCKQSWPTVQLGALMEGTNHYSSVLF